MTLIVIAGTIEIDPAKRDAVFAAAKEIMVETHKEDGNVAYAFSQDLEDEGTIHIFEEWESQEALDAHFKTPHMATFQAAMGGFGIQEMSVQKYSGARAGPLTG